MVGGEASWVLGLRPGRQDESSIPDLRRWEWGGGGGPGRCVEKMLVLDPGTGAKTGLVFDELVDMVLGPVLAGGDFEDESNDEQGLLGVPAGDHLGANRRMQGIRRHRATAGQGGRRTRGRGVGLGLSLRRPFSFLDSSLLNPALGLPPTSSEAPVPPTHPIPAPNLQEGVRERSLQNFKGSLNHTYFECGYGCPPTSQDGQG